MRKTPVLLSLFALLVAFHALSFARPAMSVKRVRTVFDAGGRGDDYFNSRLRAEMRGMGLRFVHSRAGADAVLQSNGQGTPEGGFEGFAVLTAPSGREIWSAKVTRAPRSRVMAFDSLADKLRAARR